MNSTFQTAPWLAYSRISQTARLRLFCFPYAGGGALIYRGWPSQFPATIDVCPVQLPGRGTRLTEPLFKRIGPAVSAIAEAIKPLLDRPFALFGHSMGALISFELARLLRREQGISPVHVMLSGRHAPQVEKEESVPYNLPEPEFLEKVSCLNGTPPDILKQPELLQLIVPLLRADFELCQSYKPSAEAPLDCNVTAFGGLQDCEVKRPDLEAWKEHTSGAFSLRMLPGDHFFLNTSQQLLSRVVVQELNQYVRTPAAGSARAALY